MYFKDRRDAGKKLAKALEQYRDVQPIVYALPREGVVPKQFFAVRFLAMKETFYWIKNISSRGLVKLRNL